MGNLDANEAELPPVARLSFREKQVLTLIAEGLIPTEIGAKLFLSVKTVSTYRARCLDKLGCKTTTQLILFAFNNGLLPLPLEMQKKVRNAERWEMLVEQNKADHKEGLFIGWYDHNATPRLDGLKGRDYVAIIDKLIEEKKVLQEADEAVDA